MLFRGIKHQVDKGPVDSVTGKAKYTLNDNRLLREDVEYRPLVREGGREEGRGIGRPSQGGIGGGRERECERAYAQWCLSLVRMRRVSMCDHCEWLAAGEKPLD